MCLDVLIDVRQEFFFGFNSHEFPLFTITVRKKGYRELLQLYILLVNT